MLICRDTKSASYRPLQEASCCAHWPAIRNDHVKAAGGATFQGSSHFGRLWCQRRCSAGFVSRPFQMPLLVSANIVLRELDTGD